MTQPVTDWTRYRRCGICRANWGMPCTSASGRIVDGQPDGIRTALEHPHTKRKLRIIPAGAR